jgi:predicted nucleic acid-binding Zn ribbon protein
MAEMSAGTALRELQKAQAGMKKARELLKQGRANPRVADAIFGAGWESLTQAYRLIGAIPAEAADDAVLTKQLAVGRYATALLVRLRRLKRRIASGAGEIDDDADDFDNDDGED